MDIQITYITPPFLSCFYNVYSPILSNTYILMCMFISPLHHMWQWQRWSHNGLTCQREDADTPEHSLNSTVIRLGMSFRFHLSLMNMMSSLSDAGRSTRGVSKDLTLCTFIGQLKSKRYHLAPLVPVISNRRRGFLESLEKEWGEKNTWRIDVFHRTTPLVRVTWNLIAPKRTAVVHQSERTGGGLPRWFVKSNDGQALRRILCAIHSLIWLCNAIRSWKRL